MEKILASILASFVAPQNLNQVISSALKEIGQHLALNRSYMMQKRPNEDLFDNTHEWCSHGISPRRNQLRGISLLPEWMDPLGKNQNIVISDTKNVSFAPSPFESPEMQAILIIPMWDGGKLSGFIGFEDLSGPRNWREDDIRTLQMMAQVFRRSISAHHTERELRKTRDQLEAVFNCIADPLNVQDRSFNVLMCNPARASLYNAQVQDIIGRKCYEAFHNRTNPCLSCAVVDVFKTGQPSYRLRCRKRKGAPDAWADVFAFPIRNDQGEVIQAVEFARDITKRKQAEDEIKKLYAEMEQKVEERTQELQTIQEELLHKEKLALIGQLIGSVGHEFRSSLTILAGVLYLLKNRSESEDIEEFIDTLSDEIHKMSKFVEDLLDFSRTTPPHFQQVDLEKVLQKLFQKINVPQNIQVIVNYQGNLPPAYVDPDHAEQIFHNIISNAIQAMSDAGAPGAPASGTLTIEGSQEDSKIVFSFTDTGRGIAPINIKKIFTPLFTTRSNGTGLGLSIVNMLIKKNKGTVAVESVPNQGTTFRLFFPMKEQP